MKGFNGAALLTLAAGLAGLAEAKQPNNARVVENADMAAMPNMNMLQHGVELTQRGPHGGWRAYGDFRGGSPTVNVGIAATVTADVNVAGTVAATVKQVCDAGRTLCSPGFCADLDEDTKNCGQCGFECPKYSACLGDFVCECPEGFSCRVGDERARPACGTSCTPCPPGSLCVGGECVCPHDKPELCEIAGVLPYCANIAGDYELQNYFQTVGKGDTDAAGDTNPYFVTGDIHNCGSCGYNCPMADQEHGFGIGICVHTYPQLVGEPPAHRDRLESDQRICPLAGDIDLIAGGGVCADWDDDRFRGSACADCTDLDPPTTCLGAGPSATCDVTRK